MALKEAHDIGVLDDLLVLRLGLSALDLRGDSRLVLAGQDALVVHGVDLVLQLALATWIAWRVLAH